MLDPTKYNVEALRTFTKERFYDVYSGKIPDIDKVWEWLNPPQKEATKPKSKK